ncbi:universal stress protein [Streptomyces sp. NPDC021020]|uniref:universal stress protein n=1 Tax=Streptomyces sp. NPDC021020 TaxID=3365109 RepID=UPI0037964341
MPNDTIIVGVDGSAPSVQALRWAGRQAELTGGRLVAVMAWELPGAFGWAGVPGLPQDLDMEEPAVQALAEAVKDGLPPTQAETVEQVVVLGNPAQAILDRADEEDADLIVVGVRGHGTFRATLLGSVSHTVTVHADCPVVVVRGGEDVPETAGAPDSTPQE